MDRSGRVKHPGIILIVVSFFSLATAHASAPPTGTVQNLSVEEALETAYNRSLDLKVSNLSMQAAKIIFDNAWDTMYMPTIAIDLSSASAYTVGTIPNTPGRVMADQNFNRGYPASTAALRLGSYTLFNFWRDRLVYDNARLTYDRAVQRYYEQKRTIRFRVINTYFRVRVDQEKLDVAKRSLDVANAILNLIKSRQAIGKATADEVSSSAVDLLTAKINIGDAEKIAGDDLAALNILLDANSEQQFHLTSELKYTPIKITAADAFQIYKQTGPNIRDIGLSLKISEANVEISEKSRLPLPTVSFSGVTLAYGNNYTTGSTTVNNSNASNPGGQLNVEAAVTMSIPLLGPGGLLGSRTVAAARISRDTIEIQATQTSINGEVDIQRRIASLKHDESTIKDLKESFERNSKILDSLFEQMSKGTVTRLELRDAILQARSSETSYLDGLAGHLAEKTALTELLGVDLIPGDIIL